MVKLEVNRYLQLDTFVVVKNKISVIVEEKVAGESEDKLLVPSQDCFHSVARDACV